MSSTWSVYKHISPNGKVYVGITHQKPEYRWNNGKGYKTNKRFARAIDKYGWEQFVHEIIADGLTEDEAVALEKNLIKLYGSADKKYGYNVALGGHIQSEESRKKIGETRKARGVTSWTLGKHLSKETREKISKSHTGSHYSMSDEGRENIRRSKLGEKNPNYGKRPSDETIAKQIKQRQKPVVQINGEIRTMFDSATEAGKAMGIAACNITRVCRGDRLTAGGYRWEYA